MFSTVPNQSRHYFSIRIEPRAGYVTGRTGAWALATEGLVDSADLHRHLEYIVDLIFRGPDRELHEAMSRDGVKADVSCFWRGGPVAPLPAVSEDAIRKLRQLPAEIETDFEVSEA